MRWQVGVALSLVPVHLSVWNKVTLSEACKGDGGWHGTTWESGCAIFNNLFEFYPLCCSK